MAEDNIWTWTNEGQWFGHVVWAETNRADYFEGPFESEEQAVACIAKKYDIEEPAMESHGKRVRRPDLVVPEVRE